MYRLLNILFSDDLAARFSESGNKPPRDDLDTRSVSDKSSFWLDVRSAFMHTYPEDHALHQLVAEDDFFLGIDTSTFKPHSAKKLYEMWKEVDKLYIIAERKFTTSGQHENEFRNFVNGCGYVLYLQKCLNLKPELRNFAKGGLLSTDEYDTLDDNGEAVFKSPAARPTPSKGKRGNSEHMEVFTGAFVEYVKDRRVEAERAGTSASTHLQEKSCILKMLRDIRHQLSELDTEMANAGEATMERLKEDRALLLRQRQSLIDDLKGNEN
ncbi:hypothetical protein GN958_ATG15288 [Phytophthora infestans]|uniref:Uncharacterized protein n=1 Tax=Phytophthora infestans TaxID=4787 RepID=A0A8S9U3M5_PHYIN|nr:hypothetical protein GN958_ATG15288 [Phytophthora infestans]